LNLIGGVRAFLGCCRSGFKTQISYDGKHDSLFGSDI